MSEAAAGAGRTIPQRKPIDETFGGNVIELRTRYDAVQWGRAWERQAERMGMLYDLACIRYTASEALLKAAEKELARLREIVK